MAYPRRFRVVARATALLLAPALGGAPALAASSPSPADAVSQLNAWRASVSPALAVPVSEDPAKTRGCQLHAEHWRLNRATGHGEAAGSPGFTEEGNAAAASSVLAYNAVSAGPLDWESAPYHRVSLLHPRLRSTGFWAEYGISCMGATDLDAGRTTPGLVAIPYPPDGRENVDPLFDCNERPNPCDLFDEDPDGAGYALTLGFNGPASFLRSPVLSAASLVPDGLPGEPFTVADATTANAGPLGGGVALFPHRRLHAGTWYTARLAGTWTGDVKAKGTPAQTIPFDVTWRFKTAIPPRRDRDPALEALRQRGGRAARLRLEAPGAFAGQRVKVRVRPIRWVGKRYFGGRWATRTVKLSRAGARGSITVSLPGLYGRRTNGLQVSTRAVQAVERGAPQRLKPTQVWLRAK